MVDSLHLPPATAGPPASDPAAAFAWAQARGVVLVQLTPRHDRLDEVLIRALKPTLVPA